MIPQTIQEKIDAILTTIPFEEQLRAAEALMDAYAQTPLPALSPSMHLAYLAFRMPATYAAITDIYRQITELYSFHPSGMFDIGAGCGTAFLAATAFFDSMKEGLLIERSRVFVEIGQKLGLQGSVWKCVDICDGFVCEKKYDVSIASYALGEMDEKAFSQAVSSLWNGSSNVIIVIEPGTPRGYATILRAREQLINFGAHVIAPCPHNSACPLRESDWCHFSVRLPRNALHRRLKRGTLAFEDEKYSYVALTKSDFSSNRSRIIRAPCKRSGHVHLVLCTQEGIEQKTISRKQKALYAVAKKSHWGDIV